MRDVAALADPWPERISAGMRGGERIGDNSPVLLRRRPWTGKAFPGLAFFGKGEMPLL